MAVKRLFRVFIKSPLKSVGLYTKSCFQCRQQPFRVSFIWRTYLLTFSEPVPKESVHRLESSQRSVPKHSFAGILLWSWCF